MKADGDRHRQVNGYEMDANVPYVFSWAQGGYQYGKQFYVHGISLV